MNTFRDALAKNAIVYLPYRSATQATANNVAVAKEGSTSDFTSPVEFKLIDKNPFFAPYDIKLADDKFATYERKMTYNGYVQILMLLLYFHSSSLLTLMVTIRMIMVASLSLQLVR